MKTPTQMIEIYRGMQAISAGSSMLREAKWAYISMANGGTGGILYGIHVTEDGDEPLEVSCREYNYPDQPDSFFQEVCDGMGWDWRDSQ